MQSLGGGRMGVLCSKALGLEKNENERSMGFPVGRRQTTKKTALRLAHRHSLTGKTIVPSQGRGQSGCTLQNRSLFFISGIFP